MVDLWLIHWPPSAGASVGMWREVLSAQEAGHARAVGVSNYGFGQLDELTAATDRTPEVNQIRWGPALHDASVLAGRRNGSPATTPSGTSP